MTFQTKAPFRMPKSNVWNWVTWTHGEPNKHAAILDKAAELGAVSWDFGQADHYEASRSSIGISR